jgi:hypothetical protein
MKISKSTNLIGRRAFLQGVGAVATAAISGCRGSARRGNLYIEATGRVLSIEQKVEPGLIRDRNRTVIRLEILEFSERMGGERVDLAENPLQAGNIVELPLHEKAYFSRHFRGKKGAFHCYVPVKDYIAQGQTVSVRFNVPLRSAGGSANNLKVTRADVVRLPIELNDNELRGCFKIRPLEDDFIDYYL